MVFDNVDKLTWSVFDILPEGQQGNIIITSQDEKSPKILEGCEKVSIDMTSRVEARALLFGTLILVMNPQSRASRTYVINK